MLDKSLLVRVFGHMATLIHSDTTVLDRWLWIKQRLPNTRDNEKLIDIGCGTGSFTIGSSLRGYQSLGLSWDERNQRVAQERAKICNVENTQFEVQDVRYLNERKDLISKFDVAICIENIEHILDDQRLFKSIADCLKPGGRILLTAPYHYLNAISSSDKGPFKKVEDGGHVRRGYTEAMFKELCKDSSLILEEVSFCTGYFSQKVSGLYRALINIHPLIAWLFILPLRVLPPILDRLTARLFGWPYLSICMEAYKPRF